MALSEAAEDMEHSYNLHTSHPLNVDVHKEMMGLLPKLDANLKLATTAQTPRHVRSPLRGSPYRP
jgi:hypothetical protein